MVCRENPARSAIMGWHKKRSQANGDGVLHDAVTQSLIHEHTHELEAATPLTKEEQINFVKGVIAQVEADPDLTDAEKYREYTGKAGQTGIVTRLREELRQLETGLDRHGRPVSGTVKENSAAFLASMTSMGTMQGPAQAAQRNFLETNARGRGISMKQAETEWRQLMNQSGNFSNISLTDTFRDNLGAGTAADNDTRPESLAQTMSMAGITARDQAELGQSGRARNAMAVMEQRRLDAIAGQPARPAMHDDFCATRSFVDPKAKGAMVRCAQCGQFGHEQPACPNEILVSQRNALQESSDQLDRAREALKWRKVLDAPDDKLAGVVERFYPEHTVDSLRETGEAKIAELTGGEELSERQIARRQKQLDDEAAELRAAFDRSGGTPSWVREARYNPANGVLQITPQPRTRKDGTTVQDKPFRRRISPQTWAELTDGTDAFGKRLSALGLARNPDESYRFENAADAAAAGVVTKCLTCGQFASMNSSHRCPVRGGPSENVEARNAAHTQAYREAIRDAGRPLPPQPRKVLTGLTRELGGRPFTSTGEDGRRVDGSIHLATQRAVAEATATNSTLAQVGVQADLPDANITGQVRVWSEDGQRYMSPFDDTGASMLKCSCPDYAQNRRCRHLAAVAGSVARRYQAANGSNRRPDGNPESSGGLSLDAPLTPSARVDYATLAARRADRNSEYLDALAKRSHARTLSSAPVAMSPTTADGDRIEEPATWSRDEDQGTRPVPDLDLNDAVAVQKRLRKVLSGRGPRTTFPVSLDESGGITIGIQRATRGRKAIHRQREQLRELLGLHPNQRLDQGYYIPPTGSARYEALDRAYGDPQRIHQSRWVLNPTSEDLAAAGRARVAAEHKY